LGPGGGLLSRENQTQDPRNTAPLFRPGHEARPAGEALGGGAMARTPPGGGGGGEGGGGEIRAAAPDRAPKYRRASAARTAPATSPTPWTHSPTAGQQSSRLHVSLRVPGGCGPRTSRSPSRMLG